jgi:hypothetical protein
MRSRIFFVAIAVFWVVMDVLLWRSQSASHSKIGSAIPVEVVWNKILTAPDNSSLEIYDHDKKIGFCQWTAIVGNVTQALNESLAEDYAPDKKVALPSGYALNLDGNTTIMGADRARFDLNLRLGADQTWQDFHLSAKMKLMSWDIHAVEATQKIMVKFTGDNGTWQRVLKFSELQHPEALLGEIMGADMPAITGLTGLGLGMAPGAGSISNAVATLHWDAHEDWMRFGHSRVQVYRVETRILGQPLYLFTSRVGEILWVEGPNKLTLRNEAFSHF